MSRDKCRGLAPHLLANLPPGFSVALRTCWIYLTRVERTIVRPRVVTKRSGANAALAARMHTSICMTNCCAGRRMSFLSATRARTLIYGGTSTSIAASCNDGCQNLLHSCMKKRVTTKTISAILRFAFAFLFSTFGYSVAAAL